MAAAAVTQSTSHIALIEHHLLAGLVLTLLTLELPSTFKADRPNFKFLLQFGYLSLQLEISFFQAFKFFKASKNNIKQHLRIRIFHGHGPVA